MTSLAHAACSALAALSARISVPRVHLGHQDCLMESASVTVQGSELWVGVMYRRERDGSGWSPWELRGMIREGALGFVQLWHDALPIAQTVIPTLAGEALDQCERACREAAEQAQAAVALSRLLPWQASSLDG